MSPSVLVQSSRGIVPSCLVKVAETISLLLGSEYVYEAIYGLDKFCREGGGYVGKKGKVRQEFKLSKTVSDRFLHLSSCYLKNLAL